MYVINERASGLFPTLLTTKGCRGRCWSVIASVYIRRANDDETCLGYFTSCDMAPQDVAGPFPCFWSQMDQRGKTRTIHVRMRRNIGREAKAIQWKLRLLKCVRTLLDMQSILGWFEENAPTHY